MEGVGKLLTDAALRKTTGITLEEVKKAFKAGIEAKNTLRDEFGKLIDECLPDKKLVVFIDDLDRCLPEKTIEILEVIKLFLDVPKCVFIIGVEKEVIEQGIEVRYKTKELKVPIKGKDYIEKIIQVPFTLPPIREEDMTKFVESLGISDDEKGYAKIVAEGTGYNPRKVKLFLNTLRIRKAIIDNRGAKLDFGIATKLLIIEYTFDEFYNDVVTNMKDKFLCKFEQLVKGEADEELEKESEDVSTIIYKAIKKYNTNFKLRMLFDQKPNFCGVDIGPYIYLSGKSPKKILKHEESWLDKSLSLDPKIRKHTLSKIKSDLDLKGDIITKINDEDRDVRWKAAKVLGEMGGTEAAEALIKALGDEYEPVRYTAIEALVRIGHEALDPLIEKALTDKENVLVLYNGISALRRIGDKRAIKPLEEVSKGDYPPNVRKFAEEAIKKINAKSEYPLQNKG